MHIMSIAKVHTELCDEASPRASIGDSTRVLNWIIESILQQCHTPKCEMSNELEGPLLYIIYLSQYF